MGTALNLDAFEPLCVKTVRFRLYPSCWLACTHSSHPARFGSLNSPWTVQAQERGNVSFLLPSICFSFKRACLQQQAAWALPWQSENSSPCHIFLGSRQALWCVRDLIVTTVVWEKLWNRERRVPSRTLHLSNCLLLSTRFSLVAGRQDRCWAAG